MTAPASIAIIDPAIEILKLREEVRVLQEKIAEHEFRLDKHRELIDNNAEMIENWDTKPGPMQRDRSEVLRALLVANNGKMLAKDARRKMHLPKNRFSELLKICKFVEIKPYHLDSRLEVIILKSQLLK